jgi:hypothetical protein
MPLNLAKDGDENQPATRDCHVGAASLIIFSLRDRKKPN